MPLTTSLVCSTVLSLIDLPLLQEPAPSTPAPQQNAAELRFQIGGTEFRRYRAGAIDAVAMRRAGGAWQQLEPADDRVRFVNLSFDPLVAGPAFAGALMAPAATRLAIVQFHTQVMPEYRQAIADAGGEVLHVLPSNALIVRTDAAAALRQLPCVRWVGPLPNGCKLDAAMAAFV
jgi:hypothetical protein